MKENSNSAFDKFQIEEYRNLSLCHFESVKQVSIFFRYYLLILAAPVFIFSLIPNKESGLNQFFSGNELTIYYNIVFLYFIIVSVVGFFILLYIINLRHDAILYAKSVNKTRRYFYTYSKLPIEKFDEYLNLPIISSFPRYFEKMFFFPLVTVFSLINCGFLYSAFHIKMLESLYLFDYAPFGDIPLSNSLIVIVLSSFIILHFLAYKYLSYYRSNFYLKKFIIGIDIDGVLNNQTKHFVKWFNDLHNKQIKIDDIKEIPIHYNKKLKITNEEETIVFNIKEYWETLEPEEDANRVINNLQKKFGLKVVFFTYRDWPQHPKNKNENIKSKIQKKGGSLLNKNEINSITYSWLFLNGFISNKNKWSRFINNIFRADKKVVLEKGNPYISDSRFNHKIRNTILNNNRFRYSSKNGPRFFIEDNLDNAIRLSNFCNFVFLYNQPYNSNQSLALPVNIIRVKNWIEIERHIKSLL